MLRRACAVLLAPVWLVFVLAGWLLGQAYMDAPLTAHNVGMAMVLFFATVVGGYLLGWFIIGLWRKD